MRTQRMRAHPLTLSVTPLAAQDEFYTESARQLAQAAKRMDIDQEIANAMPTVANVGEAPHHHRHAGARGALCCAAVYVRGWPAPR